MECAPKNETISHHLHLIKTCYAFSPVPYLFKLKMQTQYASRRHQYQISNYLSCINIDASVILVSNCGSY